MPLFLNPLVCQCNVLFFRFVADVMAITFNCRDGCLTASHERVQYDFILERIHLNQPSRQFDRERGGMTDLASRFGGEIPDGLVIFQEFIAADGVFALGWVLALEAAFGKDQDVFVHIAPVSYTHLTLPTIYS